jgi:hypothetical protein
MDSDLAQVWRLVPAIPEDRDTGIGYHPLFVYVPVERPSSALCLQSGRWTNFVLGSDCRQRGRLC